MNSIAFKKALTFTLKEEGGFEDDQDDSGGRTMEGITQRTYDRYRIKQGLLIADVRRIAAAELEDLYATEFWIPSHCDDMSLGLACCQFDWAVQHGVPGAIENLQQTLQVVQDGIYGPGTRAALAAQDHDDLWREYNQLRREHYRAIIANVPKDAKFAKGWLGRVDRLDAYVETL